MAPLSQEFLTVYVEQCFLGTSTNAPPCVDVGDANRGRSGPRTLLFFSGLEVVTSSVLAPSSDARSPVRSVALGSKPGDFGRRGSLLQSMVGLLPAVVERAFFGGSASANGFSCPGTWKPYFPWYGDFT